MKPSGAIFAFFMNTLALGPMAANTDGVRDNVTRVRSERIIHKL